MKNPIAPEMTAPLMFVRNTGEYECHITLDGWTGEALCGARPIMRSIGWTHGALSAFQVVGEVCEDCKEVNRKRCGVPAR